MSHFIHLSGVLTVSHRWLSRESHAAIFFPVFDQIIWMSDVGNSVRSSYPATDTLQVDSFQRFILCFAHLGFKCPQQWDFWEEWAEYLGVRQGYTTSIKFLLPEKDCMNQTCLSVGKSGNQFALLPESVPGLHLFRNRQMQGIHVC